MTLSDKAANKIKTAIRKLPADGEKENEIIAFFGAIIQLSQQPARPKTKTRRAGRDQVKRQLDSLRSLARKLREQLDSLSEQAVQSMWDAPAFLMQDGTRARVNLIRLRETLSLNLELLDHVSRQADTSSIPEKAQGNSDNKRVDGIAKITSYYYQRITGHKPDLSIHDDRYRSLLQSIFDALQVGANVERATKDLIAGS